ncbi:DNA polymerase III subunit alpha [Staphylococcus lugdunensis]|uniref:DNA polymerase III subunit alpha n=1 Tax=Staphylococcus lugdunensis TaxID=28035 RepID=UPI0025544E56|nr:DNA polymerase III subunit alpha [Staphylococcus lugdunensis]MDK7861101.1 DNA polymerase III subunit alpha [Staphylococcus lugdunensis]
MVVHLNIHTSYDLLNSSLKIEDVVAKASKQGYTALAITDTNVLYGYPKFYDACVSANIKPIFGMTVYITDGLSSVEAVLYALNNEGLTAMYQLSSAIKMKDKSLVPFEWITKYQSNIAIVFKQVEQKHGHILEKFLNDEFIYVNSDSKNDFGLPRVWLRTARYLNDNDADTIAALQAIKLNEKLDLVNEMDNLNEHFLEASELDELTVSQEEWAQTQALAEKCNAEIQYHQSLLPQFKTPDNSSSKAYLWKQLVQRLKTLQLNQKNYIDRLNHEFKIITNMGFEDYFLIVSDLIHYAKTHDVMVGPGRGSSAGSLVSYLLGITTIDPIKYNLLFERFLNPERVTMPDIDIDFEDTRRERVIEYVQQKYGEYHVSGIVTFGHLLARAVARDVGRIMGFDEITLAEISKIIPHQLGITLNQAYDNDKFKDFVHRNYRHEKWFELCKKLEGLPRHTSTHAAGIIINDQPLFNFVPLTIGDTGLLTQWTMTEAERLGLLKIDFLGLRNLSIIHQIVTQVKYDLNVEIDIEAIPFDDPKVFALLSQGETTGIFQLESEGVRHVLQRLKPQHFEDIVAVTSLYRPGPMEEIPTYITRRHEPSKVAYLHPDLEPILKSTYGVIIYQEQIMQIASRFAGFSYGEADILRRAMSKKNRAVLENERQHFVEGAQRNGYEEQISKQIFDLILKFADYGFPRAHAVSYSKIAYIMSYLKVHYLHYFYANILSNVVGNEQKTAAIIEEAKIQGIAILPPHINHSHWFYKATPQGIYLSLGAIKGVGYQSVKTIVNNRKEQGNFKSFKDFSKRIPKRIKTRKLLESLILVGAFDSLGHNRATSLQMIDEAVDDITHVGLDIFDIAGMTPKDEIEEQEELNDLQLSTYEKEYLGFYISKHPVEKMFHRKQFLGIYTLANAANHQPILVQFDQIKQIRTKKGQQMAFVVVNDGIKVIDGVIFPEQYRQYGNQIQENEMYIVSGKFEQRNQKQQLVIQQITYLEDYQQHKISHAKQIVLRHINDKQRLKQQLQTEKSFKSIDVNYFDETTKQMQNVGYIEREQGKIEQLIDNYKPEDIRII